MTPDHTAGEAGIVGAVVKGTDAASFRPVSPRNFYSARAMSEAERLELEEASEVEGLADEIAMLRVELKKLLDKETKDFKLMTAGVEMLVKAVAAQYRLSPKSKKDLAANFAAVLNSLGDQILPADR